MPSIQSVFKILTHTLYSLHTYVHIQFLSMDILTYNFLQLSHDVQIVL